MTPRFLKSAFESRLVRYLGVGGLGYIFEISVLLIASRALHLSDSLSVTLSYWLGLVFSFGLQKVLAFRNRDVRASSLGFQTVLYALLVLFNYFFTLLFVALTAAAIGLVAARTFALIVCTGWNFFAYKQIIFNEKIVEIGNMKTGKLFGALSQWASRFSGLSLLSISTISLVTMLAIMSALANPVADDYAYFKSLNSASSPLAYVIEHYESHNGRLSQNLLVTVLFELFGTHAIRVAPFLLFLGVAAGFSWLAWMLLVDLKSRLQLSLTVGFLLAGLGIVAVPSPFDTYLWFTSSSVYLGSLIGLALSLGIMVLMCRSKGTTPIATSVGLLVMFVFQTFSEPTALATVATAFVWFCWELGRKRWMHVGKAALAGVALSLGFFVNFFAPSTLSRSKEVELPFSIRRILVGSLDHYATLFSSIPTAALVLALVASAVVAYELRHNNTSAKFHLGIVVVAVLSFLGSTYFVFVVSSYGSSYFPLRNFTLPAFGTVVAIFLLGTAIFGRLFARFSRPMLSSLRVVLLGVACIVATLGVASSLVTQIQALAVRDAAVTDRAHSIQQQLAMNEGEIEVRALPVLVRSEAVEIENHDGDQVPWLIDGFRFWFGLSENEPLKIEKVAPGYCVPGTEGVKEEFVCGR